MDLAMRSNENDVPACLQVGMYADHLMVDIRLSFSQYFFAQIVIDPDDDFISYGGQKDVQHIVLQGVGIHLDGLGEAI